MRAGSYSGTTPSGWRLLHFQHTAFECTLHLLVRRVMAVPALRRLYLETLVACAASVAQPDQPVQPGQVEPPLSWFEAELLRERAQILEAARADRMKPHTNERLDEAHAELLDFARQRSAYVEAQVRRAIEKGILGAR